MSSRLKDLVRRFSTRTEYFKEKTVQPPTPSTDGLDAKSGKTIIYMLSLHGVFPICSLVNTDHREQTRITNMCNYRIYEYIFLATSGASAANLEPPPRQHRLDSFVPASSRASGNSGVDQEARYIGFGKCKIKIPKLSGRISLNTTLDATSKDKD